MKINTHILFLSIYILIENNNTLNSCINSKNKINSIFFLHIITYS